MAYSIVKLNKARCKKCGEILVSNNEKTEESCGCGHLKIGGGHSWIKRTGVAGVDFEELAVLNFGNVPDSYADGHEEQLESQTEG
jgi:hypothetical protein